MLSRRCRHNGTWIIGAHSEWCWECGAYRGLEPVPGTPTTLRARTRWVRPVGIGGTNPWKINLTLPKRGHRGR